MKSVFQPAGVRTSQRDCTRVGAICHLAITARARATLLRYDANVALPIDKLKQLVAHDPNDPALYLALGQAYLEAGQFIEAVTSLERAVTLNPKYTAAYWPLGKALEGAGRVDDAMVVYQQGLAVGEQTHDAIPTQKMRARLHRLRKQRPPVSESGSSSHQNQ
ncbi:MAG: tetratricopeptide repeat protein [Nitrospirota bacterium]